MAPLILLRPRAEILAGRLIDPATKRRGQQYWQPLGLDLVNNERGYIAIRKGRATAPGSPLVTTIGAVNPNNGTDDGGDAVRIHLSRCRSGTTVTIGGATATVTGGQYGINGYVDVTTPAGTPGLANIVVTDTHGIDTLVGGFEFLDSGGGEELPADTILAINWASGLGSTAAVLVDPDRSLPFDTAEGDFSGGGGAHAAENVLTSIATTGLGMPLGMTNCLKVKRPAGVNCYGFLKFGKTGGPKWPALAATGDANFWRVYLLVNIANNQGNIGPGTPCDGISGGGCSHHPIQFPHDSGNFEPANFFSQSNGMMDWEAYTFANGDGQNTGERLKAVLGTYDAAPYGAQLPKFTVLRKEWMFRKDASGYSIHIRIYDATNEHTGSAATLLWSEDGIGASQGAVKTETSAANQHTMASQNGLYNVGLTAIRSMAIGEEGGYYGYSSDQDFEWGGLMMRTEDWCGPYKAAEEDF